MKPSQKAPAAPLRLRRAETPGAGLRRIARGQIAAACRALEGEGDPHQAVHEARKALKKLRALLRLAAPEWSREGLRAENKPFREAARLLAPLRDAEVRLQTFDTQLRAAKWPPEEFTQTRAALEASSQRLVRGAGRRKQQAVALLHTARTRVQHWRLNGLDEKSVRREIRRSYRQARKALALYRQTPNPATLHAWRKRMKTLGYHLRIARNFLSKQATKAISDLNAMGEAAGNVHDLAVLRDTLAATGPGAQSALLIGKIERLVPASTRSLLARGAAFCREKPRVFAHRLGLD